MIDVMPDLSIFNRGAVKGGPVDPIAPISPIAPSSTNPPTVDDIAAKLMAMDPMSQDLMSQMASQPSSASVATKSSNISPLINQLNSAVDQLTQSQAQSNQAKLIYDKSIAMVDQSQNSLAQSQISLLREHLLRDARSQLNAFYRSYNWQPISYSGAKYNGQSLLWSIDRNQLPISLLRSIVPDGECPQWSDDQILGQLISSMSLPMVPIPWFRPINQVDQSPGYIFLLSELSWLFVAYLAKSGLNRPSRPLVPNFNSASNYQSVNQFLSIWDGPQRTMVGYSGPEVLPALIDHLLNSGVLGTTIPNPVTIANPVPLPAPTTIPAPIPSPTPSPIPNITLPAPGPANPITKPSPSKPIKIIPSTGGLKIPGMG